jgi:branched-chain amino acid transport system permease protein
MLITLLVSLAIGFALSRVEADYYALGSFGFTIIVYSLFLNWNSLTGGSLGIFAIPRPSLGTLSFSSNVSFLFLSLLVATIILALSFLITRSHFGRVLRAIRDDEAALAPFSYKTYRYKLIIFAISASFASITGSLYATYISFIDPSSFTLNESIYILTIVILGGLASLRGSIVGALILTLLPELLRFVGLPSDIAAQTRVILYGVALMYLMYKRPSGLFGKYSP